MNSLRINRVMRRDHLKVRLFRVTWDGRPGKGGWPTSHKLAVAIRPKIFSFSREPDGWRLTLCGIDLHRCVSHGGRFA